MFRSAGPADKLSVEGGETRRPPNGRIERRDRLMRKPSPCGGRGRRQFLAGAAALPALAGLNVSAAEPAKAGDPAPPPGKLGIPGPYPGLVVEARNPAMIRNGEK